MTDVETIAVRAPSAEPGPHTADVPLGELATGASVGRYLVIERIGAGGMGVVYAAWDPELDRKIALKLVRASWGSGQPREIRSRLLREAQALAKLSHPNVVTVHDVGTVGEQIFVAMEFVAGVTLATWGRAQRRGWEAVLGVYVQAGRGLAAAHARGLVHRDFKPDNVMLDRDERVVVMDFGLVRATAESHVPSVAGIEAMADRPVAETVTEAGAVLGTPAYMAPEQLVQGAPDARADQFSFCVALWEALYGERPFAGETLGELMSAVLDREMRPEPRGSGVPRHVRAPLLRGLASEAKDRYPSMDELLAAVTRDPRRRRRRLLAGSAIAAVVIGTPLALVAVERVNRERDVASCTREAAEIGGVWNERRAALEQAFVATGASHAASSFAKAAHWLDEWTRTQGDERETLCLRSRVEHTLDPASYAAHLACFEEQRDRLAALVDVFEAPSATMIAGASKAAAAFSQLESCADPRTIAQRPLPPADTTSGAAIAEIRRGLARASALGEAGDYAIGVEVARAALTDAEALAWQPLVAEARLVAASLVSEIGDYDACVDELTAAYRVATTSGYDMVAARAAIMLQRVLGYHLARTDEGLAWAMVATAWLTRLDRTEGLDGAQLANNTGLVHEARVDLDEAERWHRRALLLREQVLGVDHPETGHSHGNLGNVELARGQYDAALVHHRRALAVREAGLGLAHPDVARSHANIGRIFVARGEVDTALAHFQTAYDILARTVGVQHRVAGRVLNSMGDAYLVRGDLAAAREHFERALAVQAPQLGAEHPETAESSYDLGVVLHALGEDEAALSRLRAAATAYERPLGREHRLTVQVLEAIEGLCGEGYAPACLPAPVTGG